jgi:hypothetical protein
MELLALIFWFFVLLGIFSMDRGLGKIEKSLKEMLEVQRQSLTQQRENAKALQWLVDREQKSEVRDQRSEV